MSNSINFEYQPTVMDKIEALVRKVFEKAEKESTKNSPHGLSVYLESKFHNDLKCYHNTSYKTIERAYKKYIDATNPHASKPKHDLLEAMSRYLGYKNYEDFINNYSEEKLERETDKPIKGTPLKRRPKERLLILILGISLLGMLCFNLFFTNEKESSCMTWQETKFIEVSCDLNDHKTATNTIVRYDAKLYKHMKRIPLKAVEVGKSYYYKADKDSVEFFSWYGKHPVNGEDLKPVTEYMYGKYVRNRLK
ncbi:hypothetical protein HX109_06880 [Galbibacter sp. BG1]|uniref:hypothetical protein n=1 Tax=Galbibacter sp. BG1 TaxID=1170699 RepID=UPI0015BA24E8|nr:hypothetical protein [Galbibacter sp. BG1]QLE01303.1 hypothetical protein HX109_06880 [Galbibacter sp. BG1]